MIMGISRSSRGYVVQFTWPSLCVCNDTKSASQLTRFNRLKLNFPIKCAKAINHFGKTWIYKLPSEKKIRFYQAEHSLDFSLSAELNVPQKYVASETSQTACSESKLSYTVNRPFMWISRTRHTEIKFSSWGCAFNNHKTWPFWGPHTKGELHFRARSSANVFLFIVIMFCSVRPRHENDF